MINSRFFHSTRHVLAVSLWGTFVHAAHAAAAVAAEPAASASVAPAEVQQVVVSGTEVGSDRKESTTAKLVVTRQDLDRYADTNIADTLRRVPGVSISGSGTTTEIRLRGLGSGYTQVLVNGDPVPPGFSIESISPALIDRIEVLQAPTLDQGARGIAGSINIILREALHRPVRQLKLFEGGYAGNPRAGINGSYGDSNGATSYEIAAELTHQKDAWHSSIEQNGFDANGVHDLQWNTLRTETTSENAFSLTPSITWKPNESRTVKSESLLVVRSFNDGVAADVDPVFGEPPVYDSDSLHLRLDGKFLRTALTWNEQLGDEASIEAKLGGTYLKRLQTSTFHDYDPVGAVLLDEGVHSIATERSFNSRGKYRVPVIKDHGVAIGWDGETTDHDESRIQRESAPAGYPAENLDEYYRINVGRVAVFAEDEWDLTSRLSAYWGARWEVLQTRVAGSIPESIASRSSVLSPVLQTTWKIPGSDTDQLRFAVARTYKAPTVEQLNPRRFVATENTPTTPDQVGNASLRPELAWGVDLTFEHYIGKEGSLVSANAFGRRIDNVIVQTLSDVGGIWVSQPANSGVADVEGIEFDANFNAADIVRTWPQITLRANVAWNHSHVGSVPGPDNRLARQTPFTAGFGFDFPLAAKALTIGADYSFVGGGPVQVSAVERQDPRPQRSLDAYLLWSINKTTNLRLSGTNMLGQPTVAGDNVRYVDGSGSFSQLTTNHTSRVWKVTLEHSF